MRIVRFVDEIRAVAREPAARQGLVRANEERPERLRENGSLSADDREAPYYPKVRVEMGKGEHRHSGVGEIAQVDRRLQEVTGNAAVGLKRECLGVEDDVHDARRFSGI